MPNSTRQLAAIMFTDIAGYTALMEQNEQSAFQLLDENRKIQRPLIEKFNGKWLKEIGDGNLASFTTISDAIYCAGAIQKACEKMPSLSVRIGIHLGEVVFKDGDVFGSGVNIASRLESIAPVGGILISESVYRNIKNKEGIKAEFLREETLKNVDEPIKIYQVNVTKDEPPEIPVTKMDRYPTVSNWKGVFIGAVVIVLLLFGYVGYKYIRKGPPMNAPVTAENEINKSIAVLPFTNMSNDPERQYFSDGIMEAILNDLTKIGELKVISRTSVMQYRDTKKTSPQIAEELGVTFLLEGGVQTAGEKVRVHAQLIDAGEDKHIWSENYDRELADIFAIQSEVAQQIASQLKTVLTPQEIEQIDKQRTDNLEAYNSYLMGRFLWNKRTEQSMKKSIEYFEEALTIDPKYALAYAGLADAYFILANGQFIPEDEGLSIAKEQALKALKLDQNLSEAHATLGFIALVQWQWKEAETNFLKAIELSPNYATGRLYYSNYLLAMGPLEDARKQINIALELDPLSMITHVISSIIYYNSGELEMSLKENLKVLEFDPNRAMTYWRIFVIYKMQGKDHEAYKELKKFWSMDSSSVEYPELTEGIYIKTGIDGVIRWWMDEVKESSNNLVFIAWHYALIGEKDLALDWLEKAYESHSNFSIKLDRTFENLRSEPRFIAILEKMGLDPNY